MTYIICFAAGVLITTLVFKHKKPPEEKNTEPNTKGDSGPSF